MIEEKLSKNEAVVYRAQRVDFTVLAMCLYSAD